jgi:hypothetical protein
MNHPPRGHFALISHDDVGFGEREPMAKHLSYVSSHAPGARLRLPSDHYNLE